MLACVQLESSDDEQTLSGKKGWSFLNEGFLNLLQQCCERTYPSASVCNQTMPTRGMCHEYAPRFRTDFVSIVGDDMVRIRGQEGGIMPGVSWIVGGTVREVSNRLICSGAAGDRRAIQTAGIQVRMDRVRRSVDSPQQMIGSYP